MSITSVIQWVLLTRVSITSCHMFHCSQEKAKEPKIIQQAIEKEYEPSLNFNSYQNLGH